MKKLLLLLSVCFFISSCGSKYIPVEILERSKSFVVDGSKNDLYIKSNNWMVEYFNDAKSIVQFRDKESGSITGKYLFKNPSSIYDTNNIYAIIKIQVKDGAAKISIDPNDYFVSEIAIDRGYGFDQNKANKTIDELINSFQQYLENDNFTNW